MPRLLEYLLPHYTRAPAPLLSLSGGLKGVAVSRLPQQASWEGGWKIMHGDMEIGVSC